MDSSRKIEVAANDAVKKLGYEKLKELQLEVITGIVNGHDVFAVMPKGYGKSLCYGCLPRVFDTCTNLFIYPSIHGQIYPTCKA